MTSGTAVVVEDDSNIAELIDLYLRREGFRVLRAADGEGALGLVERERPRVVILDIGLEGSVDGYEVCRSIRARSTVPILFVTARDDEIDRILGLELGADDYLTKPFSPRELVARVRAVLRRSAGAGVGAAGPAMGPSQVGTVVIDPARREVRDGDRVIELTTREFDLLTHLVANGGLVLSRQQLLDGVWGLAWIGDPRTVDVHVAQLRKKLPGLPLATVRGVGYRLS